MRRPSHRHPLLKNSKMGASLLEVLAVIAIIGIICAVAMPAWSNLRSRTALRIACDKAVSDLRALRSRSISEGREVGWRLRRLPNSEWTVRLVADGNGNGLRASELSSGTDHFLGDERLFLPVRDGCTLGFPLEGVPDPSDSSKILRPGTKPIRFGTSSFISFSPIGGSTPGSIFLTEPSGRTVCVRLFGGTARPHLLRYEPSTRRWFEGL